MTLLDTIQPISDWATPRHATRRNFDIAKRTFDLPQSFLDRYKKKKPDFGPLGEFTYKRTYARAIEGEDRLEDYWETVQRVVEGVFSIQKNHCEKNHLPWDERKAQRTARRMYEAIWDFKFLPPGRGLWAMGTPYIEKCGGSALNNCAFVTTETIADSLTLPFTFLMDMSMVGVGVGFDTNGKNTCMITYPGDPQEFVVHDSREGWVRALEALLEAYTEGTPLPLYDYSQVRGPGLPIKGFGGTSSGPAPLNEMLDDIREILNNAVGRELSAADIVDIGNLIGRCVVAGNVRRSAEIVFGDPDDEEYALLKQDMEKLTHHRWASNNSIFAKTGMDYSWHAKQTATNGEPGYFWLDNARAYGRMKDPANWKDRDVVGANPCNEQSLHNLELCTLVETFPSRHDTLDEYLETLKLAYLYAKTVTLVPTQWAETNAVMNRNRRIGTSQSGIIKAFGKHGRRTLLNWSDKGYDFIAGLDVQYSNWMGIPRSIKMTSVKPSGSVSLLPGETPGIHYPHSEHYIRRIRVGIHSPLWSAAEDAGYHVEAAVGQEETTMVVSFPIKEEYFSRSKRDVSIWEQVSNAVAYQREWADNQVSVTVTVKEEEKDDIAHVLELYEDSLKGISFLPLDDHGYVQAPYEEIDEETYLKMSANLKLIDFNKTIRNETAPKFCDGDTCEV